MKPDYNALSKRLTTIQFPNTKNGVQWLVDNEVIQEYHRRTYVTRGKITKVLRPFEIGQAYNDSVRNLLGWLQDAIGVYDVPDKNRREVDDILNGRSYLWSKMTTNVDGGFEGNYWHDYLGDENIATDGGRVVVVLSDEGVKWLNEIADKVKEYISVDVPTTKSAKENSEVEILPPDEEDVKNLIQQFYTYLNEDETDWSIGYKLIQEFWDPKANLKIVQSLREGSL